MEKKDLGKLFLGSILLLAGTFMILGNFFKLPIFGILFLPVLGLFFIIWAIVSKEKELLIPGGIVEGVGLGVMFVTLITNVSEISKGGLFFTFFSIGWFLIVLLSKIFFKKVVLWPLIPFAILFLFGFVLLLGEKGISILQNFSLIWPYLLIGAGVIIIITYFRRKK